MKPKPTHGGKRPGAGRNPVDPAVKKITVAIVLSPPALARIDARAAARGWSRSATVQRWAERLPPQ